MYETHCKSQFEAILDMAKEAKEERKVMSDRLFKTNGKRSIVACIEDNKKNLERHIADSQRPVKTVKTLKASLKDGIDISGYSAMDVVKILIALGILTMMVVQNKETLKEMFSFGEEVAHVVQ